MIDIENNILKNYFVKEDIKPELKKEHELNENDRMHLINKKIDENFLIEIYDNLIERKNYLNNDNTIEINDYVFNDVEFMQDHYLNGENGIFNKLNNCNTKIGTLLLKKILLNPISDLDILKKRQDIIRKISYAKNELKPLFEKINELEKDLIWFWNDHNIKHIDLMNDLIYFNYDIIPFFNVNEILNNNEKALLITNIYKIIISPALTIITPLLSILVPLIFIFYFQRKTNINIPTSIIIKQYMNTIFSNDSMNLIFKNPSKAMIASLITKGIYLFMYFQNIYYSFQSSSNTNKIINIIHEKLNKMSEYTKISYTIKDICNKHKIIDIVPFINYTNLEGDLSVYNEYFKDNVFKCNPSLFTNKGKILCTFKNFKKNKDDMVNLFHNNGIIDAILSIENILSTSNSNNPYCLTTFLNKNKPTINIKNIWHPFLDNPNTVKNNVDINNNILITGPNAGGKSTFIKSVIINIILSQTIGISSSENFEITPFHLIETYLHIPDSKGISSLFEAEMIRSKKYIDKIKNMDDNKFSFIVLDEIFSSTNYVEGFSGAYSILKKISSFSNTLSITTTHYTDLEVLEKDTKGKIVNYKFDIDRNENNEIIFNYILKKGTSRQYIALELLKKNGFDDDVIDDAINMCKKVKENKIIISKKKSNKKIKNKKIIINNNNNN
jgi:DNA mismatch repair protein MutS